MSIRPLYDRIVVKRIKEQETTRNGIFIPDSAKEKPQDGEVMALGHGKRLADGELVALDVKVGDRIGSVANWSGHGALNTAGRVGIPGSSCTPY